MKKYYLVISTNMGNSRIFESKEFDSIEEPKKLWKQFSLNYNFIANDLRVEVCSIVEDDEVILEDEKHELSLYYNGINN